MGKRKSTRASMKSKGERRNIVGGVGEMRRDRSAFEKEANKRKDGRRVSTHGSQSPVRHQIKGLFELKLMTYGEIQKI